MSDFRELILRREEHEDKPAIPLLAGKGIPHNEPLTVTVAMQRQQLRIAARVGVYRMPPLPLLLEVFTISELYRIRHRNAIAFYTKYLHFLKCLHKPRYLKP